MGSRPLNSHGIQAVYTFSAAPVTTPDADTHQGADTRLPDLITFHIQVNGVPGDQYSDTTTLYYTERLTIQVPTSGLDLASGSFRALLKPSTASFRSRSFSTHQLRSHRRNCSSFMPLHTHPTPLSNSRTARHLAPHLVAVQEDIGSCTLAASSPNHAVAQFQHASATGTRPKQPCCCETSRTLSLP